MLKELPFLKDLRAEIAKKSTLKDILLNFKKSGNYRSYSDVSLLRNIINYIYAADLTDRYFTRKEIIEAIDAISDKKRSKDTEELVEELMSIEP